MKHYEPWLYRCYVPGDTPENIYGSQIEAYKFDRDPAAERAVAAWENIERILAEHELDAECLRGWDNGLNKRDWLSLRRLVSAIADALPPPITEKEAADDRLETAWIIGRS